MGDSSLYSLLYDGWVRHLLLITVRIYGAMMICPLFSKTVMPNLLKMSLALVLAMVILPSTLSHEFHVSQAMFGLLMVKEAVYGVMLSFILALPFWLVTGIGNFIDMQRGEQLGAIVNHLVNTPDSSIAKLLTQSFTIYLLIANYLLFFFVVIWQSIAVVPLDGFGFLLPVDRIIGLFSSYCYWIVMLALPIIVVMFLLEVMLGIISSFIPQLNVTVLAMPIKSALALFLMIFYLPSLYHALFTKYVLPLKTLF